MAYVQGKIYNFQLLMKKYKDIYEATGSTKITESYLLQSSMLCQGPIRHDGSSNHEKNVASNSLGCNVET